MWVTGRDNVGGAMASDTGVACDTIGDNVGGPVPGLPLYRLLAEDTLLLCEDKSGVEVAPAGNVVGTRFAGDGVLSTFIKPSGLPTLILSDGDFSVF